MDHITSERLRMAERAASKVAGKIRREHGVMARAQVKATPPYKEAEAFKNGIAKDIISQLAESYPEDGFTHDGEELKKPEGKGIMWHINALGGFENFVRGKEGFYLLFVVTQNGKPTETTAYNPLQDIFSMSVKGTGAVSHEGRMRVSGLKELKGGAVHLSPSAIATAPAIDEQGAEVRITGSFVEDTLAVCAGKAEGLYGADISLAETMFAALMITESGGKTSRPEAGKSFMGGNIKCYNQLTKCVS